jgi:hypothetical protein
LALRSWWRVSRCGAITMFTLDECSREKVSHKAGQRVKCGMLDLRWTEMSSANDNATLSQDSTGRPRVEPHLLSWSLSAHHWKRCILRRAVMLRAFDAADPMVRAYETAHGGCV